MHNGWQTPSIRIGLPELSAALRQGRGKCKGELVEGELNLKIKSLIEGAALMSNTSVASIIDFCLSNDNINGWFCNL